MMRDIQRMVMKMLAPLQRRIQVMVARGVLQLVDETTTLQMVQVTLRADELRGDVERFQQYGFSSMPQAGAEAIVLHVGGSGDHPVVIAVEDRRYRPKTLFEGETCLYTLANGIRVLCKADGSIELGTAPTDFVALATPTKTEISALRDTVDALVLAFNAHGHLVTGVLDSVSGPCTGQTLPPASPAAEPALVNDVKALEVKAL